MKFLQINSLEMHITKQDLKKYFIFSVFILWLLLFSHLFYLYIQTLSKPIPVKWWVLLEGVVTNKIINPFPYIANNYYSKYVQHLLFRSCLNDLWQNDLCEVSTNDRKTFYVKITGDNYWSDGRKITLDDVFFTYNDVIKNNSFNLWNPIPNNLLDVEKLSWNTLKVVFSDTTVNNWSFFKQPILPKHILFWATKDFYVLDFIKNFVNSTCVKIDSKSNFKTTIVLDYKNCKNYYFDKYQFNLVTNWKDLKKYLTGSIKLDLFNWYENFQPQKFNKYDILLPTRYALFWNVKKQTNSKIKAFLSKKFIEALKSNEVLSNRLAFNGYWLFKLPEINLSSWDIKNILLQNLSVQKQQQYQDTLQKITKDYLIYTGENKSYFVKSIQDKLAFYWTLTTWYSKIAISANSGNVYFLKTYIPFSKKFKYVVSEKFKNIKPWENNYVIYGSSGDKLVKIWNIKLFYKKIVYPKFKLEVPDFKVVYLNSNLDSLIGDIIVKVLTKIYPGKVIVDKVGQTEYTKILKSQDYDLAIWSINFDWKDISYIFLSKDPLSNPSNFVNPNFANLIKQDLLAPLNKKKKIFSNLNKIYQQVIPVVILGNEKMWLFVNKKYKIPNLDYSYFSNRKKMLKYFVITYIKKPITSNISFNWFVDFIKSKLK